jgi:RNA polymerase sigma-70 factor (ECF subfamily)
MIGRSEHLGLGETVLAHEKDTGGCEERFTRLVARQSHFVFRVAYAVLRHSHDAEDVVQEVFLRLYQSTQRDELKDERAYLSRIAWRMAVDRRLKTRQLATTEDVSCKDSPSPGETPEEAALREDWSAVVHRLIDSLPEDLRLPLALSATADFNSREIGRILGIPEGTVRTRLMRAREILRQKLSFLRKGSHGE